jgi:hypothetical protein
MIGHPLKASLLRLVQDPGWNALQQLAGELVIGNNTKRITGNTMDEIGLQALERQAQNDGIKRLLNEASAIASGERDTE